MFYSLSSHKKSTPYVPTHRPLYLAFFKYITFILYRHAYLEKPKQSIGQRVVLISTLWPELTSISWSHEVPSAFK